MLKFHRTAAWATVGVAALVRRDNGTVAEARVGLTNMGTVPVRAAATEQAASEAVAFRGGAPRGCRASQPGHRTARRPARGAGLRRRHLARVLTGRALAAAAGI